MKSRHLIPVILALALAGGIYVFAKNNNREQLPPPQDHTSFTPPPPTVDPDPNPAPQPLPAPNPASSPAEVNLNVPFTSQAPHKNWSEPYQNFCEEASALMAASYMLNQTLPNADDADAKLLAIKAYEDKTFGYYMDTTAAETAKILTDFYGIKAVKLLDNPTTDDVKQAVAGGKVVLVPASGKDLPNPNFTNGGPVYHMLLVKGYTKDGKFITNDPGTRLGANFLYKYDDLMNAIHDWVGFDRDIHEGKRVVIVVG
jgi:hypothetical protein